MHGDAPQWADGVGPGDEPAGGFGRAALAGFAERLARLPDNHPSGAGYRAGPGEPGGPPGQRDRRVGEPADRAARDGERAGRDAPDGERRGREPASPGWAPPLMPRRRPAEAADGPAGGADASRPGRGHPLLERLARGTGQPSRPRPPADGTAAGPPRRGEPYQPWFAVGGDGRPWFSEDGRPWFSDGDQP
jgi:hypothetical protein